MGRIWCDQVITDRDVSEWNDGGGSWSAGSHVRLSLDIIDVMLARAPRSLI